MEKGIKSDTVEVLYYQLPKIDLSLKEIGKREFPWGLTIRLSHLTNTLSPIFKRAQQDIQRICLSYAVEKNGKIQYKKDQNGSPIKSKPWLKDWRKVEEELDSLMDMKVKVYLSGRISKKEIPEDKKIQPVILAPLLQFFESRVIKNYPSKGQVTLSWEELEKARKAFLVLGSKPIVFPTAIKLAQVYECLEEAYRPIEQKRSQLRRMYVVHDKYGEAKYEETGPQKEKKPIFTNQSAYQESYEKMLENQATLNLPLRLNQELLEGTPVTANCLTPLLPLFQEPVAAENSPRT